MGILHTSQHREPRSNGRLIGQKAPPKLKDIWTIRIRLQLGHTVRDLALFNLTMAPQLRACDLVKLRVSDVSHGGQMGSRAMAMGRKTDHRVRFATTQSTREAVLAWITHAELKASDFLFTSRVSNSLHLKYARIVHRWVEEAGLTSGSYGTHTMRRTKAPLIYRRTRGPRVVRLLLGHTKLASIVCYLGIEVDDALEIAEQTEG